MAPELQWVQDAADIISKGGVPLFCLFLLYIVREQRTEMKAMSAAKEADTKASNVEVKTLLKSTIEVAERSNAGLTKAGDASDEVAQAMRASGELLRSISSQNEQVNRSLDRNHERMGQLVESIRGVGA